MGVPAVGERPEVVLIASERLPTISTSDLNYLLHGFFLALPRHHGVQQPGRRARLRAEAVLELSVSPTKVL